MICTHSSSLNTDKQREEIEMANGTNEKVKRRYFRWLREAKGYSEQTVVAIERAIHLFEESTGYKDFKSFSERQATGFKNWLGDRRHNGKPLSNTTKYHTLRHATAFFSWLSTQSGFRSRISLDSVSYLSLDRRTVHEALSVRPRKYPSLEQVKSLVESIDVNTDIDRRDQALIAFMLLTGIRYTAICTLSLGCFDVERLVVFQDPRMGVQTKGGKAITTHILKFDTDLVKKVVKWARYLVEELKFGPCDPLFPKTLVAQTEDGFVFEVRGLAREFWSGGNSIREILRRRSEQAGLPYFNPHSFRHAACQLALRLCRTPEEFKALSQNFGHEQVTTTLRSYGNLDDQRIGDVISKIDFSGKKKSSGNTVRLEDIQAFIDSKKEID